MSNRLTKRERAAIREALCAFIADDHDDWIFDERGFEIEDAQSALDKLLESAPTTKEEK